MSSKKTLAFYISHLHDVGGIETFTKNLVRLLADMYDITVYASNFDIDTAIRLSEYANIKRYKDVIEADVVILSTALGVRPNVKSDKVIQTIHGDFEALRIRNYIYKEMSTITHYVAVSEQVKKTFELATKNKVDKVIYNLL